MEEKKNTLTITEAAKINRVSRQAIYVAIKQNKLKATKKTRWEIQIDDLENYRNNKYSRLKSTFNGELLYDNAQGYYSINQVAKMLQVPVQKVYYATRSGLMKAVRKGCAWVVHLDDVKAYQASYVDRRLSKRKTGTSE